MNTSLASTSIGPSVSTASSTHTGHGHSAMPAELEQTLSMLSSHRSVLGYILLSRGEQVSIIRHSGVVFEGEQGKKYAAVIRRIIESVKAGLEEVSGEENEGVRLYVLISCARSWSCDRTIGSLTRFIGNSFGLMRLFFIAGQYTFYEDTNKETRADDLAR